LPIRSRSPFRSTSSSAEALLLVADGVVVSSANRAVSRFRSRFRQ
jgi:hypothetical protein